jgi:hypothetical protein
MLHSKCVFTTAVQDGTNKGKDVEYWTFFPLLIHMQDYSEFLYSCRCLKKIHSTGIYLFDFEEFF